MPHRLVEDPARPGLILSTFFDAAAADETVTPEQAEQAAQHIRLILDGHDFPALVMPIVIMDRFHGVSILADAPLPRAWGIGTTCDGVPVLFDRIAGGIRALVSRPENAQDDTPRPPAPRQSAPQAPTPQAP